jgi:Cobalamin-independent synthase, Catalytic domain
VTVATGVGSWPGRTDAEYAEAVRLVLGEVTELPYLPELPGRGVHAGMVGRTLATISDLGFDLQPAGWRLTDAPGVDQRRARSLLSQDLDQLEDQAQDFRGVLKIQLTGPLTLAATVERPRGDKVLADHGARRELAQALAEGVETHLADVRRRVDAEHVVVQVDEPALASVLAGSVPTASGFGKHRAVRAPEASEALAWVFERAGTEPWAHSCAPGTPWALLRGAGARGMSGDLSVLGADELDAWGEALDAGERVALGVVPSVDPDPAPAETSLTEHVLRTLDLLGLDPDAVGDRLVLTPSCGLAGASPDWARRATALCRDVARNLTAGPDGGTA